MRFVLYYDKKAKGMMCEVAMGAYNSIWESMA